MESEWRNVSIVTLPFNSTVNSKCNVKGPERSPFTVLSVMLARYRYLVPASYPFDYSLQWIFSLSHLQRCLWWTMHGKGVLFPEPGLNLTAYQKVLLQGLQLGTTAHWRFAPYSRTSPGGGAVNRDVSLTPPAAKPSWMLLPKPCLIFSARASGLLFQLE